MFAGLFAFLLIFNVVLNDVNAVKAASEVVQGPCERAAVVAAKAAEAAVVHNQAAAKAFKAYEDAVKAHHSLA
ncbi:hypothetical protein L596_026142 [Steinernema carpocapsae]|uniref:Nematode cuticle collagen N-terminal domain-containing protein n=1 Tax=Steinernema carpocapsae TaxID=34508 RepID=A0A4V5ZY34_STECR|nr:hypothetical protein L596_026142 [Steinernema carpocapsae]